MTHRHRHPEPRLPSLLSQSVWQRVGLALGVVGLLWLGVAWALGSGA